MDYEYGRIRKLADSLVEHRIPQGLISRIMEGGEDVRKGDKPPKKTAWLRDAMNRMDSLLDLETRKRVRESCACCLTGEREKAVNRIAKAGGSLEERVRSANETKLVFGNSVKLQEDGSIVVCFFPEGREEYRCACMGTVREPVSITYCYCCGGHVKHHTQNALGLELDVTVLSSALASAGKEPCRFRLVPTQGAVS